MKMVTTITGSMAPLPRANVDTDQIMPKQFLKRIERTGYGELVFSGWRRDEPEFVLNRPEYQNAKVLVAGPNFGSGSSREHAPWGLQDWGFEAIIAPSFADIFQSNCTKIGLLPVVLTEKEVAWLLETATSQPDAEITIDVSTRTVTRGAEFSATFDLDDFTRYRMLNGLDDIGLTLRFADEITSYEGRRPAFKPVLD